MPSTNTYAAVIFSSELGVALIPIWPCYTFWFLQPAWVKPDALRMAYLVSHKYTIVVIASASFVVSLLFCHPGMGSLGWWAFSDFSSGKSNLKGYSGGKYKCNISSEIQMSNKGVTGSQGLILRGIRNYLVISKVTCSLVPLRCIFNYCFWLDSTVIKGQGFQELEVSILFFTALQLQY